MTLCSILSSTHCQGLLLNETCQNCESYCGAIYFVIPFFTSRFITRTVQSQTILSRLPKLTIRQHQINLDHLAAILNATIVIDARGHFDIAMLLGLGQGLFTRHGSQVQGVATTHTSHPVRFGGRHENVRRRK